MIHTCLKKKKSTNQSLWPKPAFQWPTARPEPLRSLPNCWVLVFEKMIYLRQAQHSLGIGIAKENLDIYSLLMTKSILYCNSITGLIESHCVKYDALEWRLFINSSTRNLKAVLNIENMLSSILIGHSVKLDKSHPKMECQLSALNYHKQKWLICTDIKVMERILGLQESYAKYPFFKCLWDSRDCIQHYVKKEWPLRQGLELGSHNVLFRPFVEPAKILLPPLHIKLRLMENFIKALDKEGEWFAYLHEKFSQKSEVKITAGVFDGPHIKDLIKDKRFESALNPDGLSVWMTLNQSLQSSL